MADKNKIILKGGYIPQKLEGEELQIYLRERSRGCGVHKSKKDYRRTEKHRVKNFDY